jgi:N-acetylglutamate synthase-like GNAT family acetyltransferase
VSIVIKNCTASQFQIVKKYIEEFELDNRELHREQFVVAFSEGELIGFGRVREYHNLSELCSLGVLKKERSKGVGKKLFQAMIEKAQKTKYLACIIPGYFTPFGFEICNDYPHEMQIKLDYCTCSLPVEETYVIMKKD